MRIDKTPLNEETKAKIVQMLNDAEDKTTAITEAMEMVISETQSSLIEQVVREAKRAEQDAEYKKSLGLRPLSEAEKKFYEMLKGGAKQALTAAQIDIIPIETIDKTLEDVRTEYPIMDLINFAPANVKHWLTGSKSGAAYQPEHRGRQAVRVLHHSEVHQRPRDRLRRQILPCDPAGSYV